MKIEYDLLKGWPEIDFNTIKTGSIQKATKWIMDPSLPVSLCTLLTSDCGDISCDNCVLGLSRNHASNRESSEEYYQRIADITKEHCLSVHDDFIKKYYGWNSTEISEESTEVSNKRYHLL